MSYVEEVKPFKDDFDRFISLMEKQIAAFPEELWLSKVAVYPLWQQVYHVLAWTDFFSRPQDQEVEFPYSFEETLLLSEASPAMTQEAMLKYAGNMRELGHAYMARLRAEDLIKPHERMSKRLGQPMTNLHALIGMVRHLCYHLGCGDAILRERGLDGVY